MPYQFYKFHYPDNGFEQVKVLVSHNEWKEIDAMPEKTEEERDAKSRAMKALTGGNEWFTDKSPYFDAIETGIILANGYHKCNITKL